MLVKCPCRPRETACGQFDGFPRPRLGFSGSAISSLFKTQPLAWVIHFQFCFNSIAGSAGFFPRGAWLYLILNINKMASMWCRRGVPRKGGSEQQNGYLLICCNYAPACPLLYVCVCLCKLCALSLNTHQHDAVHVFRL